MLARLRSLFGATPVDRQRSERAHLSAPEWPAAIYAIGDVHGCLTELRGLEQRIVEDAAAVEGEKWLVYLGDLVDRGPDSVGVLDRLLARPPQGFRRICLAGNHEIMMLAFLDNPASQPEWLQFGGQQTLASYGIDAARLLATPARQRRAILDSHVPQDHVEFLTDLPLTLSLPGVVFVHAGLRPDIPVDRQAENDLLWIREEFFRAPPLPGRLVVHGHTPARDAVMLPGRICVDTGAFATGRLTAVRLSPDQEPRIIDYSRG